MSARRDPLTLVEETKRVLASLPTHVREDLASEIEGEIGAADNRVNSRGGEPGEALLAFLRADHSSDARAWAQPLADEIARGRAKFPRSRYMLFALAEEVGELAEAMLTSDPALVRDEALQVAAVAVRIAEEGDGVMPQYVSSRVASALVWLGEYVRRALQAPRAPVGGPTPGDALRALKKRVELLIENGDDVIATADEEASKP